MRRVCLLLLTLTGLAFAQTNPPVVLDQSATMYENTSLDVAAPGLLTGATGDSLTAFLVSATNGFTVTVNTNGAYSYTPPTGFVGTNCFNFAATDGVLTSATASVCVIVTGPTAVQDRYTLAQATAIQVDPPGVLDNDISETPLTAFLTQSPSHGTATLNPDGSFLYTPQTNYNSGTGFRLFPDSFQYKVTDGIATSAVADVSLNVTPLEPAGDQKLYVGFIKLKQFRTVLNRDRFSITGHLNPRGADPVLTNATFTLKVNGTPFGIPAALDTAGQGSSLASNGVTLQARFNRTTGNFTANVRNLDLALLGIDNITALGLRAIDLTVRIDGANLDIPEASAQVTARTATLIDKYSLGEFRFELYETPTGVFTSLRTTATEVAGHFQVALTGGIEADDFFPITPTGDLTITIGNHTITVPADLVAGQTEFTIKKGQVAGLSKFSLDLSRHSFSLATDSIPDTGIPLAGGNSGLRHALPVAIEFPTAIGTSYYATTIELERTNADSFHWSR